MEPLARASGISTIQPVLRRTPWIADAALGVLLLVIGAVSRPTISFVTGPGTIYSVLVVGCCVAVVFRSIRPRASLTVAAVLLVVHVLVVREPTVFAATVCMVAAYTTQTQLAPPWRWGFALAVHVGAIVAVVLSPFRMSALDWTGRLTVAAFTAVALTVAVLLGVVRRERRARYEAALERADVLETQQQAERQVAVLEERARIAREMHDVLGHSLGVIAVQAEGARHLLRSDPERADQALAGIGALSRSSMGEVQGLVDVLAADDPDASAVPAPGMQAIPRLVESLQTARSRIRLQVTGEVGSVPSQVSQAGYRIVQESLTNALKHAPGAPITVRVTVEPRDLHITVLNTAGSAGAPKHSSGGRGIAGMRERVRALGGSLSAGPDATIRGWRVHASLPGARG